MERQTSNETTLKVITFVTFGVMLALGAFFMIGLLERNPLLEKETYGLARIIEEIKMITKDLSAYIKGIIESVKAGLEGISNRDDAAAWILMLILDITFPLMSILFFFVVALYLVFSWIPLVRVESLGWNKVCRVMNRKLKTISGWILAFIIYSVVLYGKSGMALTTLGNVVLWMLAAYIVVRALLDGISRRDTIVQMVLNTIIAAVVAVLAIIILKHLLLNEGSLMYAFFANLIGAMNTQNSEIRKLYILSACYALCWYISIHLSAAIMEKQMVRKNDDLKGPLIFLFVFLVAMAVLHFFLMKKVYGSISFSDWMDSEDSKFVIRAVIYGAIGCVLAIVTAFVSKIGSAQPQPQSADEKPPIQ
ncbi:MAG: hypothetical protein IJX31_02925 [Clostridia bacterium]|nr:hypothetical protein [Clostridia bacterium]